MCPWSGGPLKKPEIQPGRNSTRYKPGALLTFHHQHRHRRQTLHVRVHHADVLAGVVELDVPDHEIPRRSLTQEEEEEDGKEEGEEDDDDEETKAWCITGRTALSRGGVKGRHTHTRRHFDAWRRRKTAPRHKLHY